MFSWCFVLTWVVLNVANQHVKILGSFEDLRKLEEKMENNYNIEYWLMDLISPDYDKLLKKIKGKNVFFDATNIFGYHMSHAYYTFGELVSSYKKLQGVLGQANKTYFSVKLLVEFPEKLTQCNDFYNLGFVSLGFHKFSEFSLTNLWMIFVSCYLL